MEWSWYVNGNKNTIEGKGEKDPYWQKLVKMIPVEIVALYTAAQTGAELVTGPLRYPSFLLVFVVILALVPAAFIRLRNVRWTTPKGRKPYGKAQISLGVAAFVIYAYANGGVFAQGGVVPPVPAYSSAFAALIALLFAGAVGIYNPHTGPTQDLIVSQG